MLLCRENELYYLEVTNVSSVECFPSGSLKALNCRRGMSSCLSQGHPALVRPLTMTERREGGRPSCQWITWADVMFNTFRIFFPQALEASSVLHHRSSLDVLLIQLFWFVFLDLRRTPRLSSGPDCVHICHPTRLWRHDTKTPIGWNEARNQKSIHPNQRWVPNTDDRRHPLFISLQVTESWNSGELMLTQTEEESLLISCPQTSHTLILLLKLLRESLT